MVVYILGEHQPLCVFFPAVSMYPRERHLTAITMGVHDDNVGPSPP